MIIVLSGCGGSTSPSREHDRAQRQPEQAAEKSSAKDSDNPGVNLQCAAEGIRKAPAPFHWSYKKIVPPLVDEDWEADIGPDSIAGTFIDNSGKRAIRGLRSDPTSWNTAISILTDPLPASTFALVANSSATVRIGTENVNGEDTIKYAIDTTRATGGEVNLISSVLGANGFIKGAAWVTPQGCPVKFVLDVEQYNTDGTAEREHHEENVTAP